MITSMKIDLADGETHPATVEIRLMPPLPGQRPITLQEIEDVLQAAIVKLRYAREGEKTTNVSVETQHGQ